VSLWGVHVREIVSVSPHVHAARSSWVSDGSTMERQIYV